MREELVAIFKYRQEIKEGNYTAIKAVTFACGYRAVVSTFLCLLNPIFSVST